MARIPYVDPDALPEIGVIFDHQRRSGRPITNFHRLIGHVPWIYKWYVPFSQAVYRGGGVSTLDQRTRQLVQIRTSAVNACAYCVSHNTRIGQFAGLTDPEVAALTGDAPLEGAFSDRDAAVVEWAETVANNTARRNGPAFERLQAHFSDVEIVELTVLAAARTMVNRVQEALWTDLEPETELDEIKVALPSSPGDYTRAILCPHHGPGPDRSDAG
jgi:AhpD family alkylhydroperoxidase